MAVELATAYISLVPSARGIQRQISQELDAPLTRVAGEAGDRSSRAYSTGFQSGLKRATSGIARTAALAFGGIGVAIGAAGVFGLKAAGDFQQTRIAFEGILGSGEKAQTFLEGLRKFAAKTPFEFPELADAAKSLLAVGFNAADVIPVMTRLGNVAATLGVGGAEINGVVRALGQMKGKGKASAEELNQISEQIPGFSAIKAIAGELGITTAEAFKKMETGAIDADTAVNAILAGMEKFPGAAGAMTRQSKTLNGVISTFKDTVRDALINGLEPLLPTLSSGIERVAPIIGKALSAASRGVADFVAGVQGAGDAGTGAIAVIGGRIRALVTGFIDFVKGNVASAGVELGKVFGLQEDDPRVIGFIRALTTVRETLASVAQFIQRNWKPILIVAGSALLILLSPVVAVIAGLAFLYLRFTLVRQGVARFVEFFKRNWPAIKSVGLAVIGAVTRGVKIILPILVTLGRGLAAVIGFFRKNADVAIALAAPLLAAAAAYKAILIVRQVKDAIVAFKGAMLALNATFLANPIVLVVAAIVALGAAVFLAYKHFKPFHDAVDKAWQVLQSVFHWVQENWPLLLAILTGPVGLAVRFIVQHFQGIKDAFTGVRDWIAARITDIVTFFAQLPGRILAFHKAIFDAALSIGKAIIEGIKNGLTGAVGFVTDIGRAIANAAIGFINKMIDSINDALEFKVKGPGFLPDVSVNPPDIGHIKPLASGGVVNQPLLALIGENSRTTPEIVSPVKLMAETFKAELKNSDVGPRILVTGNNIHAWDDNDLARRLDERVRRAELRAGV